MPSALPRPRTANATRRGKTPAIMDPGCHLFLCIALWQPRCVRLLFLPFHCSQPRLIAQRSEPRQVPDISARCRAAPDAGIWQPQTKADHGIVNHSGSIGQLRGHRSSSRLRRRALGSPVLGSRRLTLSAQIWPVLGSLDREIGLHLVAKASSTASFVLAFLDEHEEIRYATYFFKNP